MRAAEWEAKCLVIGGGNLQRGAWRLTLMERRAALAIESAKPARVAGRGRSQRPQGGTAPNGAASPMRDLAASGPSGRTLRRREGRRKRRERETTAASDKASGQTEAATLLPTPMAPSEVPSGWRWQSRLQPRGPCRRRRASRRAARWATPVAVGVQTGWAVAVLLPALPQRAAPMQVPTKR